MSRRGPAAWTALLAAIAAGCAGPSGAPDAPAPVQVYAAASTTDALNDALRGLADQGGPEAVAVVGSSSTLARQIEHGAPAQLYLSANPAWMDHLADRGALEPGSRVDLLTNRLVLVAPTADADALDGGTIDLSDPGALLAALGPDGRLAVGDPAHVPAGQYAQAALTSIGAWAAVEPRLVPTADVRAALAFVERGEAPLGVVYATDAAASEGVVVVATFPAGSHPPVTCPLALVAGHADPAARATHAFLQSDAARARFEAHGFGRP
jgi:molybdate transport system substrate-binding protein